MTDPEQEPHGQRPTIVLRPGLLVTGVILGCVAMGLAIYWLLRSMHL